MPGAFPQSESQTTLQDAIWIELSKIHLDNQHERVRRVLHLLENMFWPSLIAHFLVSRRRILLEGLDHKSRLTKTRAECPNSLREFPHRYVTKPCKTLTRPYSPAGL